MRFFDKFSMCAGVSIALLCIISGSEARAQNCQFDPPISLPAGERAWLGQCSGGHAEGPGVVRSTPQGGRPVTLWFGSMRKGMPVRGVVDSDGAYKIPDMPENFHARVGVDKSAAWTQKNLFEAAEGARAAAHYFMIRGNRASAHFYLEKANNLEETSPGGH